MTTYKTAKSFQSTDALIIGVFKDTVPLALSSEQKNSVKKILAHKDFDGSLGQSLMQYSLAGFDAARVMLVGLGEEAMYSFSKMNKAFSVIGQQLIKLSVNRAEIFFPAFPCDIALALRAGVTYLEDAHIQQGHLKATHATQIFWPSEIVFVTEEAGAKEALQEGQAIAEGIAYVKHLADLPANICTPCYLADAASKLGKDNTKIAVEIFDESAIKEMGMGCFLAVAQGSVEPPRFIVLKYQGSVKKEEAPIVFVGKGITFDSGGLCLKSAPAMYDMKYDMCGAATVLGVLRTAAQLNLPINVVGIIAATENMPSGSAVKPGDVVRSMSGKMVEILNTDAEGRLILSDALTYAERFHPKAVIDIATLTGAIVTTLGSEASGLMSNHDVLTKELIEAGEESHDRVWQLPLWEEYQSIIDTVFADVINTGSDEAKSITSGCFLARFTEKYPWAHLDVAGTAMYAKGNLKRAGTGRPMRLLMQYLLRQKNKK